MLNGSIYTAWNEVIPGPFYHGIPSHTVVYRGKQLVAVDNLIMWGSRPLRLATIITIL